MTEQQQIFTHEEEARLHALNLAIKFHEYDKFGDNKHKNSDPVVKTAAAFEKYILGETE